MGQEATGAPSPQHAGAVEGYEAVHITRLQRCNDVESDEDQEDADSLPQGAFWGKPARVALGTFG